MTAHAVARDRSDAFFDVLVKVLFNKLYELLRHIAVHSIVVLVGRSGWVDIETCACTEVPVLFCVFK